jgi:hypothetical protein
VPAPLLDLAHEVQPVEPRRPIRAEAAEPVARAAAPSSPAATVQPLTAELSRYHVTVSRRFLEKLEAATTALSRSHPNAGPEEILEAGLDLLLDRVAKRRGLVKKPRATRAWTGSRGTRESRAHRRVDAARVNESPSCGSATPTFGSGGRGITSTAR